MLNRVGSTFYNCSDSTHFKTKEVFGITAWCTLSHRFLIHYRLSYVIARMEVLVDRCSRLLVALFLLSNPLQMQSAETAKAPPVRPSGFGTNLPLAFEPNQGQTDPQVRYLARGPGYSLYLTNREAVIVLQRTDSAPPTGRQRSAAPHQQVFRLQLQDATYRQARWRSPAFFALI